ncbi:MAG: 5'/3'-nucleotidase SurE [Treponema sp.]|nr:5'/3'-nucleotidase SurE [Treponema sp.]
MNILLTNDDGIDSDGLQKLAETLRTRGKHRLFVIAPDTNRSGISNALSILNGPVKLAALGNDTWSCSGTPADCVIVGIKGALPEKPDIVLSGINRGENTGTDIVYSGTASAARQASLFGIPAVALSLAGNDGYYWGMAAAWIADHLEELAALWREDTFLNVNIPNCPDGPAGMTTAWPSVKRYRDVLHIMDAPDKSQWCFLIGGDDTAPAEAGTDCDIIAKNFVSVSSVYNFPAVRKDLCPGAPPYAAVAPRVDYKN